MLNKEKRSILTDIEKTDRQIHHYRDYLNQLIDQRSLYSQQYARLVAKLNKDDVIKHIGRSNIVSYYGIDFVDTFGNEVVYQTRFMKDGEKTESAHTAFYESDIETSGGTNTVRRDLWDLTQQTKGRDELQQ